MVVVSLTNEERKATLWAVIKIKEKTATDHPSWAVLETVANKLRRAFRTQ